jgi:hypothetical protein
LGDGDGIVDQQDWPENGIMVVCSCLVLIERSVIPLMAFEIPHDELSDAEIAAVFRTSLPGLDGILAIPSCSSQPSALSTLWTAFDSLACP